jgi:hypothetical protein
MLSKDVFLERCVNKLRVKINGAWGFCVGIVLNCRELDVQLGDLFNTLSLFAKCYEGKLYERGINVIRSHRTMS